MYRDRFLVVHDWSTNGGCSGFEQEYKNSLLKTRNIWYRETVRVLPGTDRGTFVVIVGALVTWTIYTQKQLLLWSSLIITRMDPGYK